jgi:predicted NUDIX family NTP pyrophosphohydrolase
MTLRYPKGETPPKRITLAAAATPPRAIRSARSARSAGLLVFRTTRQELEFLLVHPGGPFWRGRDDGAWSIPKGLIDPDEDELVAAQREFHEETGLAPPAGPYQRLADRRQKSGKMVLCWLVAGDLDLAGFASNTFEMEWPRGSGRHITAPECDQAAFFPTELALRKVLGGQAGFIAEAARRLSGPVREEPYATPEAPA